MKQKLYSGWEHLHQKASVSFEQRALRMVIYVEGQDVYLTPGSRPSGSRLFLYFLVPATLGIPLPIENNNRHCTPFTPTRYRRIIAKYSLQLCLREYSPIVASPSKLWRMIICYYLLSGFIMFSPARLTTASHSGKGDFEISFCLEGKDIKLITSNL